MVVGVFCFLQQALLQSPDLQALAAVGTWLACLVHAALRRPYAAARHNALELVFLTSHVLLALWCLLLAVEWLDGAAAGMVTDATSSPS